MAHFGSLEVHLHFHSLRNVDLFHQGLYQIRATAYRELGKSEVQAGVPARITINPLEAVSEKREPRSGQVADAHCLHPAFIDDQQLSFTTRTFQIRYCEEEVELNDAILFRLEVDLSRPASYTAPVYIELDLMYAEAPPRKTQSAVGKNAARRQTKDSNATSDFLTSPLHDNGESETSDFAEIPFADAAYQIFRVQNPVTGAAEYFQATFDHLHCCVVHCTVFTALIDIRNSLRSVAHQPVMPPRLYAPKLPPSLHYASRLVERNINPDQISKPTETPRFLTAGTVSDSLSVHSRDGVNLFEHLAEVCQALDLTGGENDDEDRVSEIASASSPVPDGVTKSRNSLDQTQLLIYRADLVYHQYLTLLLRTYYRLRAHLTTIGFRCLSEHEDSALDWLRHDAPLQLPARISLPSLPNGLPDFSQATLPASRRAKVTFTLPAHLCADVAEEIFTGRTENVAIAGAIRTISVPYVPPSARLPRQKTPTDPSLGRMLQHVLAEDFNLIWRQIHEVWQKLRTLCAVVHKEVQFFHQLIWEKRVAARCKEVIYLEVLAARSAALPVEPGLGLTHLQLAEDLRLSPHLLELPTLPVEDIHGSFDIQTHPIMFEERYSTETTLAGISGSRGFMERRNRLSSIQGGLVESIPEGASRVLNRQTPIVRVAGELGEDLDGLLLSHRKPSQTGTEEPFQGLKTLAYMKKAGDRQVLPMECPVDPPSRTLSNSTVDDSLDSLTPAEEAVDFGTDEHQFIKIHCPVFEDIPSAPKLYRGTHLIVFVHGFQGNSLDMRLIKNQLSLVFPEAMFLSSSANEEHTEGDILLMGQRLADEISSYVTDLCPSESIGRLSFVAHSLGGLIVRAALLHLTKFSDRCHLYMTLSTPHLGYIFARNRLVDAGLWVLKKWKKSVSLQQLSMGDAKTARDTLLYKMSDHDHLKWFKHVVLVSCFQDQYVPYESARVEISEKIQSDPSWGQIHTEMVRNILTHIKKERLIRLDVCFKIVDKSIDSFIGRTAHIHFLGSQQLAQMLVFTYPHWFS